MPVAVGSGVLVIPVTEVAGWICSLAGGGGRSSAAAMVSPCTKYETRRNERALSASHGRGCRGHGQARRLNRAPALQRLSGSSFVTHTQRRRWGGLGSDATQGDGGHPNGMP